MNKHDKLNRQEIYDLCLALLSDENGDLNSVQFQFLKDDESEIIVRLWVEGVSS
jgi:hypothetical protein